MKVVRLTVSKRNYGGEIYERHIDQVLRDACDYEVVTFEFQRVGLWRILEIPAYVSFLRRWSRNDDFFVIRGFSAAMFPLSRPEQGATIVHHIDTTGSSLVSAAVQRILEWRFRRANGSRDRIVTISEYWRNYFRGIGFANVPLIHCAYDVDVYQASPEQVADFKRRHGLGKRPVVYIGNPQRKKGAFEVVRALQGDPYDLVTSGEGEPVPGTTHLNLSFEDYRLLLRSSSVVITFSRFKEGWCRVAHEAMLMGVPVIGSGRGGMRELLEGGGQAVIDSEADLRGAVHRIVSGAAAPPVDQGYARGFTIQRFGEAWLKVLSGACGR